MLISMPEYLETQKKEFPDMHKVAENALVTYGRVRTQDFEVRSGDRDTFRWSIIWLFGLAVVDVWVTTL
jgi:hypothetical protein